MGSIFKKTFAQTYEIVEITHHGLCLNDIIHDVDIVVDFTNRCSAFVHGVIALTHNKAILIGSTGMSKNQKKTLQKIADERQIGCIISPDFSVGYVWMQKHLMELTNVFPRIHIIEQHQKSQKDALSDTALALANHLQIDHTHIQVECNTSSHMVHTILLENDYECIRIEHMVKDRRAYMMKLADYLALLCEIQGYKELF